MKRIKKIIQHNIFQNFFFISLNQGINFLALIVFVPYLLKTVGIERFGLITIMQTICAFFLIVVDYGFSITSVRALSVNRNNNKKLGEICRNTLISKFILLIISFPFFVIIPFFFLKDAYNYIFVILTYFMVVGQAFFPVWLCQGLEDNKVLLLANIAGKFILAILIYTIIKEPNDYIYYLFFIGLTNIIFGLISTFYVLQFKYKIKIFYKTPILGNFLFDIKAGKEVFISNFFVSIYLNSNVLILSLFATAEIVGIYGIVEKIMFLIRQVLGVFISSVYPNVCKIAVEGDFMKTKLLVKRLSTLLFAAIFTLCLILFIFSENIAYFFAKNNIENLSIYIKYISFVPLIVSFSVPINLIIMAYNQEKYKSYVSIFCTLLSIIFSFYFVSKLKLKGTIIVTYLVELITIICLMVLYKVLKRKNKFH